MYNNNYATLSNIKLKKMVKHTLEILQYIHQNIFKILCKEETIFVNIKNV